MTKTVSYWQRRLVQKLFKKLAKFMGHRNFETATLRAITCWILCGSPFKAGWKPCGNSSSWLGYVCVSLIVCNPLWRLTSTLLFLHPHFWQCSHCARYYFIYVSLIGSLKLYSLSGPLSCLFQLLASKALPLASTWIIGGIRMYATWGPVQSWMCSLNLAL